MTRPGDFPRFGPPPSTDVSDEVEWLMQDWFRISDDNQLNILDALCSIALTDDEDPDQRNTEKKSLINAVDKARKEAPDE